MWKRLRACCNIMSQCLLEWKETNEEPFLPAKPKGEEKANQNKSLTSFLSYVHEKCPVYPEEGTLKKATWLCLGKFLHEHPRAPPDILVTWRAVVAALGILYPNSPSTDSAAPLSSNTEESLSKVSPPPYESPTVPEVASAPPADTALSAPAASFPPSEDTDMTAGTFSALVASSSLSLRTEPPLSAYPMTIPPGGGAGLHENIN
ncbi:hypothetical protein E2320_000085, partial [Naja naja]